MALWEAVWRRVAFCSYVQWYVAFFSVVSHFVALLGVGKHCVAFCGVSWRYIVLLRVALSGGL